MDDGKTALDDFFRASYDALLKLCFTNINHFEDEPPNSASRTIIRTARLLLNDEELPEYLRLRVLLILAVVLDDESIVQEHIDKARKTWGLDENDKGWIECAYELELWLFMKEEYEDKEMPFPHHGYVVPKKPWILRASGTLWTRWMHRATGPTMTLKASLTADQTNFKSSTKSGKPAVPPKSPELYERFPVGKYDNITA